MRGRLIVIGLVLIAAAQIVAWFVDSYDRVEKEIYVGFRGEARYNPFLAAQRLTETLGYEADSRAGLSPGDWLPPITDTLVLADRHGKLSEVEIDMLLRWLYAGGSLIAAPLTGGDADSGNRLFEMLDVQITDKNSRDQDLPDSDADENGSRTPPCKNDVEQDKPGAHEEPAPEDCWPELRTPQISVDGKTLQISRGQPRLHFDELDVIHAVGDSLGSFYVRFRFGEGRVTLVADTLFSINTAIGDVDNAAMVAELVQQAGGTGKVWFVYDDSYPGVADLIWKHAPVAVVAFALLLALYLWRISRPFGPMLPGPETRSRSVLEHIRATGSLLWKTRNQQRLADAARGRLLQALERHHPGISHGSRTEQVQLIAEHSGEPVSEVSALFNATAPAAPAEFTQQIIALKRLWKKL